jgi:hypothetical protein
MSFKKLNFFKLALALLGLLAAGEAWCIWERASAVRAADQKLVLVRAQIQAVADATPAPATLAAPPPPAAVTPLAAISPAPSPWPVRLVMTLPQAQPPRAILGLPGGKEIVVTPGSMVPEEGLVVMSVGRDRVQLARIQPQGDHAAVAELTLTTQY